jgi:peroxiredoxin
VVVVALVGGQTWMFVHVLRQNGRLLLRLDALEAALAGAGLQVGPAVGLPATGAQRGLPRGMPAPAFALARLGGGTSAIGELLAPGRLLALAFVDPKCGPCTALVPELARWERQVADRLSMAVVTVGTAEANEPRFSGHGLRHVLLQKDREVSEAYQAYGTPAMVLVGADGTVSSAVAAGRDAIRTLMASVTGAQPPPAARNGHGRPNAVAGDGDGTHSDIVAHQHSRIGEAAPSIMLPDLDGRQVSLSTLAEHPTLVLFWNPGCGFCQKMLDGLKDWEASRSATSPQLFVVSTGSAEANRAMSLRSTIVLDTGFASGRIFGATGTPSAVLIDKDGRLASEVAVGAAAVLALATQPNREREAGV